MTFFNTFLTTALFLLLPYQNIRGDDFPFTSLSELIEFETAEILNSTENDYQDLSEKYLARAESYLIAKDYELAFSDFQTSYELATLCNPDNNRSLLFQALFGQAIIYGCNEMLDECQWTIDALTEVLNLPCQDCALSFPLNMANNDKTLDTGVLLCNLSQKTSASKSSCHANTKASFQFTADQPIYGPDRVSIQDCVNFALGTTKKCRYLVSLVPKPEIRVLLNIMIDDLEARAVHCCKIGGVWKSCLQPLVNKWHLWNQKWQAFGIPPDPAWD